MWKQCQELFLSSLQENRAQKSSATPPQPSTMDTGNKSLCSVRDYSCPPLKMLRTTPRAALLGESVTQTRQAPLWSHLQLCSICRQYSLSSWTLRAGSGTAALLKQCLQESHPWQHHVQGEPQAHPALYLDKRFSLQIGLLDILSPPLIFIEDFLPTLGQTTVFFCLLNLRKVLELPLASLLSSFFANLAAEKQPSWLCRTDGDKVTSNVPFQGPSSAVAPNITSVSKPRQGTAVKKGALWHCHVWSSVTAKKTN